MSADKHKELSLQERFEVCPQCGQKATAQTRWGRYMDDNGHTWGQEDVAEHAAND